MTRKTDVTAVNSAINGDETRMSAHQIAALTGKKAMHVMRDCRVMFKALGVEEKSKIGFVESINNLGKVVRRKTYQLEERLAYNLAAGYDIELRQRVIDYYIEHRNGQQAQAPTLSGSVDTMRNQLTQIHAEKKAEVSEAAQKMRAWQDDKPKLDRAFEALEALNGVLPLEDTRPLLDGVPEELEKLTPKEKAQRDYDAIMIAKRKKLH